ncbi:MAG: radical SAM family heme chaperone HemW [Lachnospiraceae bacterium]|nr:radical SAM family heme chaperone HemW [Lachnospiraceae bacterium]
MKKVELYIHIPFCEKKCNYCDFVSFHSSYDVIDKYIKKLITEIEYKKYLLTNYEVTSIYIGGGTPSFIESKYISYIMESIYNNYNVAKDSEISIEVNPNSASMNKLKNYYDLGINRLSIGLQSANDMELKILGRIHNYNDFLVSYNNAIHIGFKNINIDLINGIPTQTPTSYKKTLKQILMLNIKHLSIYNLIVENNTPMKTMLDNNELQLPLETDLLKIDDITKELTTHYHLMRYEISNYAKTGFECKHNLGYWSDVPYIGFGLNSSSYFENKRLKNKSILNNYLNLDYSKYITIDDKSIYYDEIIVIDKIAHINDYIITGFRKTSGINIHDFYDTFNLDFEKLFGTALKIYQGMSLINKTQDNYYFTYDGLNVSNKILSDLLLKENEPNIL